MVRNASYANNVHDDTLADSACGRSWSRSWIDTSLAWLFGRLERFGSLRTALPRV